MYYADIKQFDVANGPGVRVSLFVSGCTHRCKGCFNKVTWDFHYGTPFTNETEVKIIEYLKPNHISGLTLLGGEPFEHENQQGLVPLLKKVKEIYPEKQIWCFSGYTFEHIMNKMAEQWDETGEMLSYIDVLVDGKFIEAEKSLSLRFKGSANQRTIDVPESLKQKQVVLVPGY